MKKQHFPNFISLLSSSLLFSFSSEFHPSEQCKVNEKELLIIVLLEYEIIVCLWCE